MVVLYARPRRLMVTLSERAERPATGRRAHRVQLTQKRRRDREQMRRVARFSEHRCQQAQQR
jgi:hypothetical protein